MSSLAAAAELFARLPVVTGTGFGVVVVGADGEVVAAHGDHDGILDRTAMADGREIVEVAIEGHARIVCVLPPTAAPAVRPLVEGLARSAAEVARLEGDMESMNSSSLALLEHVAMVDELVSRLPSCQTDEEVIRVGLEHLLVAASVHRVGYVAWHETAARCITLIQLETGEEGQVRDVSAGARPFDPAVSTIGDILFGSTDLVIDAVPEGGSLGAPGLPEWGARREFLAVPVRFGDAHAERTLGALVVHDKLANRYNPADRLGSQEAKLAATLARLIGSALGSRMVAAVGKELKLARDIQRQILPVTPARVPGFDLVGRCETCGAVGGDYFDFVPMADGRTLALVADVSGHNLASGMVMVAARTALRLLADRLPGPAAIVSGVGDALIGDLQRMERFVSVAGVAIRAGDPIVEVVNAGHVDVLVRRSAGGVVEHLSSLDTVLGFTGGIQYGSVALRLEPGDVMLLYTDGAVEAQNARGEMFGDLRLEEVLRRADTRTAAAVLDGVFDAVAAFADRGQAGDDVTVLVVRRAFEAPGGQGGTNA